MSEQAKVSRIIAIIIVIALWVVSGWVAVYHKELAETFWPVYALAFMYFLVGLGVGALFLVAFIVWLFDTAFK